jgi:dihydroneopterin aldolase
MNRIELKGMTFHAFHGVAAQERKVGNTYTVDLAIGFNMQRALHTDSLDDTINYAILYALVSDEMRIPSSLIEHVAARILRRIQAEFPQIATLEIRLAKQNPPLGGDIREVAVHITLNSKSITPTT